MQPAPTVHTSPGFRDRRAFSLVELLIVICIIGLLATLSVPALGSLRSAGNINQASLNVSLMLEQARSYAMANNTYVWVGFDNDEANSRLRVAAVSGLTGASTDIQTSANYRPIVKVQTYDNMRLHTVGNLTGMVTDGALEISSSLLKFDQKVGGQNVTFKNALQFEPSGSVRFNDGIQRWINVGIQPFINGQGNENNAAVFQVAGLTGELNIFRK